MKTICTTGSSSSHSHAARPDERRLTASRRKSAFHVVNVINADERLAATIFGS
jgi:hypothetical protein